MTSEEPKMLAANQLTFERDGLERAAHLRGNAQEIARLRADKDARAIVIWQGRPLMQGTDTRTLARLPLDHPMLAAGTGEEVFLGLGPHGPLFATDLAGWSPDTDAPEAGGFFDDSEIRHPAAPAGHVFADLRMNMARLPALDAGLAATAKAILGWHEIHRFCANCGQESQVAMAGWQRNCPACERRHFPRTDPVVIMLVTHGNSVLLGRSPGWPEGMVSLLAGFVEPGETLETAVRREVHEETGVRIGRVSYLTSQPWPFPASLMIGCAAEALSTRITIDPVEIEHAFWISREELMDVFAGTRSDMFPARPGSVAHFLLRNWLADVSLLPLNPSGN